MLAPNIMTDKLIDAIVAIRTVSQCARALEIITLLNKPNDNSIVNQFSDFQIPNSLFGCLILITFRAESHICFCLSV